MIIYFSGYRTEPKVTNLAGKHRLLISYCEVKNKISLINEVKSKGQIIKITKPIFLDSGAFSVFTGKQTISIEEYRDFLLKHKDRFCLYANLDVIGNADATQRNQEILEEAGLNPLPTFHYGSNYSILRKMVKKYNYIGLGGIVPLALKQNILKEHLGKCFGIIGTEKKTHGWGCTSIEILKTYPFYSVDSIAWLHGEISRRKMKLINMQIKTEVNKIDYYRQISLQNALIYIRAINEVTELWKRRGIVWND